MIQNHDVPSPQGPPIASWGFPSIVLGLSAALALMLSGAASAQLFTVTSAAPDAGASCGTVALDGSGLDAPIEQWWPWVRTPSGGFELLPLTSTSGRLETRIGSVAAPAGGTLELWHGLRHSLPGGTWSDSGRLVSALCGEVFVPYAVVPGPMVAATVASPRTLEAHRIGDRLEVDLAPLLAVPFSTKSSGGCSGCCGGCGGGSGPVCSGDQPLRVPPEESNNLCIGAAIETKGDGGATCSPSQTVKSALGFRLAIAAPGVLTATELARLVALALDRQVGPLGLTISAQGSRVVVDSPTGICGGFLTVEG